MIKVFYSFTERLLDRQEIAEKITGFSFEIQQQILRYRNTEDAQRALSGKLLLRKLFAALNDPRYTLDNITYNQYSRPQIPGNYDFNISHSGRYCIGVLSDQGFVGVDVEEITAINYQDFSFIFTADELADIQASKLPVQQFFKYWTQKEAAIKADGRGMHLPLKKVKIENDRVSVLGKVFYTRELQLNANYSCHLASESEVNEIELQKIIL